MDFPLARRVVSRFIAGETCDEAIEAIRSLNAKGITGTVDHLGESVFTEQEAIRATTDYLHLLDCIRESQVASWISLKLTQLGLDISEAFCLDNLRRILNYARERGIQVTIDMEGSEYTQRTLDVFHRLHGAEDFENVRAVIQAYLYRSEADVATLVERGAGVRLCKGAYQEPPSLAFPKKADADANFIKLTEMLLSAAARENGGYPGIATHDEKMIEAARQYAAEHGTGRDAFEFQMLHGIRGELQGALVAEGYHMRVYVPYGTEWYPYFMRRLAERPANVWFIISNLLRR